jgi:hypothetical protein
MNSEESLPKDIKPRNRRTRYMIEQENKRILDYILAGASHKQIREFVGLSETHYWRRIKQIQMQDIEILQQKQTRESRAFLLERTLEKLQAYQQGALSMATNKTLRATDRIAAYQLLRQLAADEYSLETYGATHLLTPQVNGQLYRGSRETALILREAINTEETAESGKSESSTTASTGDPNRVF